MKLLTEVKVPVCYSEDDIFLSVKKKYNIARSEIIRYEIIRESVDARKKPNILFSLNLAVELNLPPKKLKNFQDITVDHTGPDYEILNISCPRPVIVGMGPSGIFAGLALAQAGLKPVILEQGKSVDERQKDIEEFWNTRKLNKFSNVQFGEGGAGTFSDGKLISNVSNNFTKKVINEFILNGAPKEIFYSSNPHIGTDNLKKVVVNMRKKIESLGGEVRFNALYRDFETSDGKLKAVKYTDLTTMQERRIETNCLILAVGHSAKDVYFNLRERGCQMQPKPFAMGVRIEHSQSELDFSQYGTRNENLPRANYKLVSHLESGRDVFSFCMCPGGQVVASSSEENTVVTNGMSYYARDGKNANSALLVGVLPSDFGDDDPLAGVLFQHKYEKLAFELGGGNYNAPAERLRDFLPPESRDVTYDGEAVEPTYLPAVTYANLRECLPDFVYKSLREAIPEMGKKVSGLLNGNNILIGIESRSSAPVQIYRDEKLMTNIVGVFACGEGAGFAGGITSSAQDGLKCAEKVMNYLLELSDGE